MASETEAAVGNTTIDYEVASTAVESPVVVVAAVVDALAAPEAGNSGSGIGSSGSGVDVGRGKKAVMIATAMAMMTVAMTMTAAETAEVAATTTTATEAAAATEASRDSNQRQQHTISDGNNSGGNDSNSNRDIGGGGDDKDGGGGNGNSDGTTIATMAIVSDGDGAADVQLLVRGRSRMSGFGGVMILSPSSVFVLCAAHCALCPPLVSKKSAFPTTDRLRYGVYGRAEAVCANHR